MKTMLKTRSIQKLALKDYVCGKRSRRRPKRRWLDGIKEDVESLNMTMQEATRMAQDQATRRRTQKKLPLRASRASPRQ